MSLFTPTFAKLARIFYEHDECRLLRELDARKRDFDKECGPRFLWIKDFEMPRTVPGESGTRTVKVPGSLVFLVWVSSMLEYLQREIANKEELEGIQKISVTATEPDEDGLRTVRTTTLSCPDDVEGPIRKVLHCGLLKLLNIDESGGSPKYIFDLSGVASLLDRAEESVEDDDERDDHALEFVFKIWPMIQQKHIWEGEDLWPTPMYDSGKVLNQTQRRFRQWPFSVAQEIYRGCTNAVEAVKEAVSLEHFNDLSDQQKRNMYCRFAQRELQEVLTTKLCPVFTCPKCKQASVTCSSPSIDSYAVYFFCKTNAEEPLLGAEGCGKFSFRAVRQDWLFGALNGVNDGRSQHFDAVWSV